jgi:hypothetical protein
MEFLPRPILAPVIAAVPRAHHIAAGIIVASFRRAALVSKTVLDGKAGPNPGRCPLARHPHRRSLPVWAAAFEGGPVAVFPAARFLACFNGRAKEHTIIIGPVYSRRVALTCEAEVVDC